MVLTSAMLGIGNSNFSRVLSLVYSNGQFAAIKSVIMYTYEKVISKGD
jgi:hypothetical protein